MTKAALRRIGVAIPMFAALAVGCATGGQQRSGDRVVGTQCQALSEQDLSGAELLRGDRLQRVDRAYKQIDYHGTAVNTHVSGAKLYIAGERGMNEAYLERALACHASSALASSHPNDPLKADGVRDVSVRSVGQTFEIAITGTDREAGERIWQRAQALQQGASRVTVRQVSAAPIQRPSL